MAWYYNGQEITAGRAFTDTNGGLVGAGWAKWPAETKTGFGITWQDDPDLRFENADGTDRALADVKADGIASAKGVAFRLLGEYDWYVVRNAEKNTAIPSEITTYRDAVRTALSNIETAINACSTLSAYKTKYSGAFEDLDDWPDKPSV